MRIFFITALLNLISSFGMSNYTVKGYIKSKGGPVSTATVQVNETKIKTSSNKDGFYSLKLNTPGAYTVKVSAFGYQVKWLYISITQDTKETNLDIQLDEDENLLSEIEVNSVRANDLSAVSYTELDKETIRDNNNGQDMPYILNLTPSTVVTSDAGAGIGYTGIRIRGSDATRVNVTINGVPLNDAESHGTFWVDLPDFASSTDNIQIQRGVGTSTNGSGAFGATVNLNSNVLKPKPYGEVNSVAGSFNTFKNTLSFGTGLLTKGFTIDGRLSAISSDGYIDRASSDLKSFYTSIAKTGHKSNFRLNVFSGKEKTYQAWYGVPHTVLDTNRTYNPYTYVDQTDNYTQTHYQFFWNQRYGKKWYSSVAVYHTRGIGYYEEFKEDQLFSDYGFENPIVGVDTIYQTNLVRRRWLDNYLYGTNANITYDGLKCKIIFGGSYSLYQGQHYGRVIWAQFASNSDLHKEYYDNDALKTDGNIFAKATFNISNKWSVYADLQTRMVSHEYLGLNNNFVLGDQIASYTFLNPKFGVTYVINSAFQTYASFARAGREPNRDDFVNSTPAIRPLPEELNDLEFGAAWKAHRILLSLNGYHMSYKNQLVLTGNINDVGAYVRQNVPQSYRTGLEMQFGYQFKKVVEWTGNFTYSQNKIKQFTEYVDTYGLDGSFSQTEVIHTNTNLSFSPSVIAGSVFDLNILSLFGSSNPMIKPSLMEDQELQVLKPIKSNSHKLNLVLISKYVGKQFLDNTQSNDRALEGYFTQDVRLRYTHRSSKLNVSVFTQANNVLNNLYESNGYVYPYYVGSDLYADKWYFPQAGINFLAGLTLEF